MSTMPTELRTFLQNSHLPSSINRTVFPPEIKSTPLHTTHSTYTYTTAMYQGPYPHTGVPMPPLLDPQGNQPTYALTTFADEVFNHLDYNCEPRGSGLLEQDKMAVLQGLILPHDHHTKIEEFRPILYNSYYMAFSVETTFTGNGPALTRAGFLTFLCARIRSDPDEAFKDFGIFSQALRIGSCFERSQFPFKADAVAERISKDLRAYTSKTLLSIGMKVYKEPFCDVCFNLVGSTHQICQDCNADFIACVSCVLLAPKNHSPGHRFRLNTPNSSRVLQESQVAQVSQVSQVSQVPQIPQVPQVPQVSQMPQMPQVSQVSQRSQGEEDSYEALAKAKKEPMSRFDSNPKSDCSLFSFFDTTLGVVHEGINCDLCFKSHVVGVRYHCQDCPDYDVCEDCISQAGQRHIPGHRFLAMESSPTQMDYLMAQARAQTLSNMRVTMAHNQIARMAGQSEKLGHIGTGRCYRCGCFPCQCGNNIVGSLG